MKNVYQILLFILVSVTTSNTNAQSTDESSIHKVHSSINNQELTLSLYPMPITGVLSMNFSKPQDTNPKVYIYDLIGNKIFAGNASTESSCIYTINLSDKKPGYYFVKIQTEESTFTRRITVAH
jgi:hypothetical protein